MQQLTGVIIMWNIIFLRLTTGKFSLKHLKKDPVKINQVETSCPLSFKLFLQ